MSGKKLVSKTLKKSPSGSLLLKDLLKGVAVKKVEGKRDVKITGITTDSRKVMPGSIFFAIEGGSFDGNAFIMEAIHRGAVAVFSEKPVRKSNQVTMVQVENTNAALVKIARKFYKNPDEELFLVGVTGTSGKTTVSYIYQYLMGALGNSTGLLGTIKYDLGFRTLPASHTTPFAHESSHMFRQMVDFGVKHAIVEVSSHGIELHRLDGFNFDIGIFTNLTPEHLDFHKDLEEYFTVKAKFFNGSLGEELKVAVVNCDDLYGKRIIEALPETTRTVTYGLGAGAQVSAEHVDLRADGTSFDLVWPEGRLRVESPLLGIYNVSNVLAVLATVWVSGQNVEKAVRALLDFPGIPGRMEKVEVAGDFTVLVDYAHKENALKHVLSMLKEVTKGRLFIVFGCGGDRDRAKRPKMTTIAQQYADFTWATSDNPRKESIESIFEDMRAGVTDPARIEFVSDRRSAIGKALTLAKPGDCVLIAGKGHETCQKLADTIIPFDDRQVVRELVNLQNVS